MTQLEVSGMGMFDRLTEEQRVKEINIRVEVLWRTQGFRDKGGWIKSFVPLKGDWGQWRDKKNVSV